MTSRTAEPIVSKPSGQARPRLARMLCAVGVSILASAAHAVQIAEGSFENRPQFIVTTGSATWFHDRAGGGFSRLIDLQVAPAADHPALAAGIEDALAGRAK